MANTQIRISELNPIQTPDNADIFVLNDSSEGETKHITFANLKSSVVDQETIESSIVDIIDIINSYEGGTGGTNGLNSTTLAGQDSSYYLNYENLTNTPDIPTNLADLTNNTGFLRYENVSGIDRVSYRNTEGGGAAEVISTDYILEGNENLYYTEDRAEAYLDENFGRYFSSFSTSFDGGNLSDSLFNVKGEFINIQANQSNTVRITQSTQALNSFFAGQSIRVYGGSAKSFDEVGIEGVTTGFTLTPQGFNTTVTTETWSYRIAEFNYETGEVSPASNPVNIQIGPPAGAPAGTTVKSSFNRANFIQIGFIGVPSGNGLLVYRQTPGDTAYKLITVLGPREIQAGSWPDYYTFDYISWSGKSEVDNSFTDIVHFPLTSPSVASRGWADAVIQEVRKVSGQVDLILTSPVFVSLSDLNCDVSHNDTLTIQNAINTNFNAGRKSITLNSKAYVSGRILIPDGFGLVGTPNITKVYKLPWSGWEQGVNSSRMVESQTRVGSKDISINGIDFIGNALNQYLFIDSADGRNYAVDLGDRSVDCQVNSCRIINPIGAGIFTPNPTNLKVINSVVRDSGVTDRNIYSPLNAIQGENTIVTSNLFANFTDYIDVSVSSRATIASNIIFNCGSGLLVAGSRFLTSSANVLVGPADELLPSPDIYNSVYDSVNISLNLNQPYSSDVYKYQENGLDFNLKSNIRNRLIYEVFKLKKSATGAESLYEEITDVLLNNVVDESIDETLGEFAFAITQTDVNTILNTYSYDTLKAVDNEHVGLIYRASLEEHVKAGDIVGNGTVLETGEYQVNVDNTKYMSVGAIVEFESDHLGFSADQQTGEITAISSPSGTTSASVTIDFGTVNSVGSTGTINIINKFTLAQGRILQ